MKLRPFMVQIGFTGTKNTANIVIEATDKDAAESMVMGLIVQRSTHPFRQFENSSYIFNLDSVAYFKIEEMV